MILYSEKSKQLAYNVGKDLKGEEIKMPYSEEEPWKRHSIKELYKIATNNANVNKERLKLRNASKQVGKLKPIFPELVEEIIEAHHKQREEKIIQKLILQNEQLLLQSQDDFNINKHDDTDNDAIQLHLKVGQKEAIRGKLRPKSASMIRTGTVSSRQSFRAPAKGHTNTEDNQSQSSSDEYKQEEDEFGEFKVSRRKVLTVNERILRARQKKEEQIKRQEAKSLEAIQLKSESKIDVHRIDLQKYWLVCVAILARMKYVT